MNIWIRFLILLNKTPLTYLKTIPTNSVRYSVFDPPYSQRQLKEMYKNAGLSFNHPMNNSYWAVCKKEIGRVMKPGGKVISFGWNTNGIGKKYGFEISRLFSLRTVVNIMIRWQQLRSRTPARSSILT